MNGFVYDALLHSHNESNPVSMFDSHSAPVINFLAKNFAGKKGGKVSCKLFSESFFKSV